MSELGSGASYCGQVPGIASDDIPLILSDYLKSKLIK